MKILIVEDTTSDRILAEIALTALGHTFVSVPTGEEALRILAGEPLRVVVSDWKLPGMDGLTLCQRIRAGVGDYVYFILLTSADDTDENHEAALKAGVDDFLLKSADKRELRMRLHVAERMLGLSTQVRQLESFLPICSYCKKIRDDQNYWQQIEAYLTERTTTRFSHGICPECYTQIVVPDAAKLGIELRDDTSGPPA